MGEPSRVQRVRNRPRQIILATSIVLAAIVAAAIIGPELFPASYIEPGPITQAPPSWAHPFGTDLNGRDLLYQVLSGTRVSLVVGLAGAAVSLFIGTAYGLIAGYAGGRLDASMMRLVDVLYSVPRLIFVLIAINAFNTQLRDLAAHLGWSWLLDYSRIAILVLALGLIEWLTMARIVRGQVLVLKTRPFVAAARALGQSHTRILTRHLLPNLAGIIIIYLTLTIPAVIIDESFLSFLGLGVQAPQSSLGSLLSDGAGALNPVKIFWWLLLFPALAMTALLLSLNFLGDALRDTLDPKRASS